MVIKSNYVSHIPDGLVDPRNNIELLLAMNKDM
jgi:hypothetical protein